NGIGADVLRAVAVLRRAHGVEPGAGALGSVGRRVEIANPEIIFLRRPRDAAHGLRVVARKVLLQELKHTARMLERRLAPRLSLSVQRVSPARAVVALLFRIVASEKTVGKAVVITHDPGSVGVLTHVLLLDAVMLDSVIDHAADKGDVGARAQLGEYVGDG